MEKEKDVIAMSVKISKSTTNEITINFINKLLEEEKYTKSEILQEALVFWTYYKSCQFLKDYKKKHNEDKNKNEKENKKYQMKKRSDLTDGILGGDYQV